MRWLQGIGLSGAKRRSGVLWRPICASKLELPNKLSVIHWPLLAKSREKTMHPTFVRSTLAIGALSVVLFIGAPAFAEMVSYKADLKGATEVPPNDSKGTGAVDATYDTTSKKLSWTVTYSGLTGPATAAHFHGPAAANANAPPVVPISGNLASPIKGDVTLTEA